LNNNESDNYKAYNKRKEYTRPMKPETSTRLKPIKPHLIRLVDKRGLRAILKINNAKINPTPTATPARLIKGILAAKYLNPKSTIPTKQLK